MPQPNHRAPLEELPDRLLGAIGDTLSDKAEPIAALVTPVAVIMLIRWIGAYYDEHGVLPTFPTVCAVCGLLCLLALRL